MNEMNNAAGSGQMEAKSDAFVTYENANVLSAAVDELAGLEFTFDRIRMPSDGDTVFEIPDGDSDRVVLENELTCIILFHHPAYTYYRNGRGVHQLSPEPVRLRERPGEGMQEPPHALYPAGE